MGALKIDFVTRQTSREQSEVSDLERGPLRRGLARALLLGLLLGAASCGGPGVRSSTLAEAEAASGAAKWERAAELWFAVHRSEEVKTPRPYLETARALYKIEDIESACAMLDQGLRAFPYDPSLLMAKGEMLEECGFKRAAEAAYARLVEIEPDNVPALKSLARLRMSLGLERAALAPLERLVELGKATASTYEELGDSHHGRGERLSAYTAYAQAIELGSEEPRILLVAAQLARDPGVRTQIPEATTRSISWLVKLAELRPQLTVAHYLLGANLAESGKKAEAIDALRRAVELDPSDLRSLTLLAELYAATGERVAAGEIVARALELGPDADSRATLESLLSE
jgi:tetratricopeptide (TPR) repeat protein